MPVALRPSWTHLAVCSAFHSNNAAKRRCQSIKNRQGRDRRCPALSVTANTMLLMPKVALQAAGVTVVW